MIISKTPLRITLAGGGTDLPSYYKKNSGYVLSLAINKYIYISLNKTFVDSFQLKYSEYEKVKKISHIKHNLIRESFKRFKIKDKLEIASIADVPSGTGLGSSGSFGVGLFNVLSKYKNLNFSKRELAIESSKIEMEKLKANVGHQDNIIAAYGGITEQVYQSDKIKIKKLKTSSEFRNVISNNLVMVYTNFERSASKILQKQNVLSKEKNLEMITSLNNTKELGFETKKLIINKNFKEYYRILKEHWKIKKSRDKNITNSKIDQMYEYGIKNGAESGKLIGAGGGGFLLFFTHNKSKLINAFNKKKVREFEFNISDEGTQILK